MNITVTNMTGSLAGSVTAVLHFPAPPPPPPGYVIDHFIVPNPRDEDDTMGHNTFGEAIAHLIKTHGMLRDHEIIACAVKKTEGGVHASYIVFTIKDGWDAKWDDCEGEALPS